MSLTSTHPAGIWKLHRQEETTFISVTFSILFLNKEAAAVPALLFWTLSEKGKFQRQVICR